MTTPAGYPEPGDTFGGYRIERRIGTGGMGIVFEATEVLLDRPVALKVISPSIDADERFRDRFRVEAQAQAGLTSAHVVPVFAHGDVEGLLYIATQLMPAGDLRTLLANQGAPDWRTALDLIAQVGAGLADAHDAGLVHRDIKPPNVLLRETPEGLHAYLADFGIARQLETDRSLTTVGGTLGTPSFMAPELHTGAAADRVTDTYSLGCLLWSTLVGSVPYGGTSEFEIVSAHLHHPVPQLAGDQPAVVETNRILRRALAKRPEDRYPDARSLRHDLLAALELTEPSGPMRPNVASLDEETQPHPPPLADDALEAATKPPPSDTPRSRRRRTTVASAAAAAVLLVGVLGYAATALLADDGPADVASDGAAELDLVGDPAETSAPIAFTPEEEQLAEDNAAAALRKEFGLKIDATSARCVAGEWIEQVGLDRLVRVGYFDRSMAFVVTPRGDVPDDVTAAATAAQLSCNVVVAE